MNLHEASTHAWVIALTLAVGAACGFAAGTYVGYKAGPSYQDALRVEYRLREVFCEQAIRNNLMKTCEVVR